MDSDTLFLTSLGTLEITAIDGEGISEKQVMPINGLTDIDRIRENNKQNTTTYILRGGAITIGDTSIIDFGSIDDTIVSGELRVYPSAEDPKKLEGKLTLVGN